MKCEIIWNSKVKGDLSVLVKKHSPNLEEKSYLAAAKTFASGPGCLMYVESAPVMASLV